MDAKYLAEIKALHEDYITYETGIHGGTGTNLLYCDGTKKGHDEFSEWVIDGFSSLVSDVENLKFELDASKTKIAILKNALELMHNFWVTMTGQTKPPKHFTPEYFIQQAHEQEGKDNV